MVDYSGTYSPILLPSSMPRGDHVTTPRGIESNGSGADHREIHFFSDMEEVSLVENSRVMLAFPMR